MSTCRVISQFSWDSLFILILAGGEYGTALQAAASEGELQIVQLLLKHKADVNLQGNMLIISYLYAHSCSGRWKVWNCTSSSRSERAH
jgi:hypothetical protein